MFTYFVSFKGGNKKEKKLIVTQSWYDSIERKLYIYIHSREIETLRFFNGKCIG